MKPTNNFVAIDAPRVPVLPTTFFKGNEYGDFVETFDPLINPKDFLLQHFEVKDMYMPHFSLRMFKGNFDYDAVFVNEKSEGSDLLGACFFFKGTVRSYLKGHHQFVKMMSGLQNFKFDPQCEYQHWCSANELLHFIQLSIKPCYFLEILPENERWADMLKNKIIRNERFVGERPVSMNMVQQVAFENVMNCSASGQLKHLMIESSMLQIFLMMLNNVFAHQETPLKQKFSPRDRDVIHNIKEYLDLTFLQAHSLTALSREFGININKLTIGFKQVFGDSIFQYITNQRMEHARKLLQHEGLYVNEVSSIVGYKNIQHFTTAFRKRFGVTPSSVKSNK